MKIVKLKGGAGIGNQLFEYAFAKYFEKTGEKVTIDIESFNPEFVSHGEPRILNFNISIPIATKSEIKQKCLFMHSGRTDSFQYRLKVLAEALLNKKYYFEWDRRPRNIEKIRKYDYFDGYWQSWEYVDSVFDELKKDLVPNEKLSSNATSFISKVKNEDSVFVGVRRGDYLKDKRRYGETNIDYYIKGMNYIEKNVSTPIYYIFSNDINWVEQNMDFGNRKIIYRREEDIVDDFEELILMSNCKHSIIQNSTYHWWGARLNYYDGKIVVAPKKWFYDGSKIDIIPPEWIKI